MHPGCPPGSAAGAIEDIILDLKWELITGTTLRITFDVKYEYRTHYFAIFINGIYAGGKNFQCDLNGRVSRSFVVDAGTTNASVYIEDAGGYAVCENPPSGYAEAEEENTANRIQEVWQSKYTQTTVKGDTQLSSITITGAARGTNVAEVQGFKQRGRLSYSILSIGGVYIVRWYADDQLVAEGSRTGNGALTCSAMNDSGLSVACTITYTGELKPGIAIIDCIWPKEWQIHYDDAALVFPRTPEATIPDKEIDDTEAYRWLSPVLAAGTWYVAIVAVGDNDVPESAPTLTDTETLNTAPLQPTTLACSGVATGNYVRQSEAFGTTPWTLSAATISANSLANPLDGIVNSDTLIENSANALHYDLQAISGAPLGSAQYTFSVYAKYLSEQWIALYVGTGGDAYALFDVQNGLVGATTLNCTSAITSIGGGWYRCSITLTNAITTAGVFLSRADSAAFFAGFLGNGTNGVYLYGAQLNTGSTPSTYVQSSSIVGKVATLTWAVGEAGCTFDAYSSRGNDFINFGNFAIPATVATAMDAVTATVPLHNIETIDRQTIFNTLATAFNSAVSTANASFNQASFAAAFVTMQASLISALNTYGTSLPLTMNSFVDMVTAQAQDVTDVVDNVPSTFSANQWLDSAGGAYGKFLTFLGLLLNDEQGRYTLPNGALGGGALGSAALGTGENAFGFSAVPNIVIQTSLYECALPLTLNTFFRFVVRATKGGIQETNHDTLTIELDSTGALVGIRPNDARIESLDLTYIENSILRSEAFDNAAWTKSNTSISANSTTAPDGAATADTLIEDSSNNVHAVYPAASMTTVNGKKYTFSVYVKANGRNYVDLYLFNVTSNPRAKFDLSAGTVVLTGGGANYISSSIESVGSSWYRCSVSFIASAVTSLPSIYIGDDATNFIHTYTGDGASGLYLWGAHFHSYFVSTTYVITAGTAVTGARLDVAGIVLTDDALATANYLDLYVVAAATPPGSTINTSSAQASVALAAGVLGADVGTATYNITTAGWYDVALCARVSSTSVRSNLDTQDVRTIYVNTNEPNAGQNFTSKVMRGRGVTIG